MPPTHLLGLEKGVGGENAGFRRQFVLDGGDDGGSGGGVGGGGGGRAEGGEGGEMSLLLFHQTREALINGDANGAIPFVTCVRDNERQKMGGMRAVLTVDRGGPAVRRWPSGEGLKWKRMAGMDKGQTGG